MEDGENERFSSDWRTSLSQELSVLRQGGFGESVL